MSLISQTDDNGNYWLKQKENTKDGIRYTSNQYKINDYYGADSATGKQYVKDIVTKTLPESDAGTDAGTGDSSQSVDYSSLFDRFYNEYLNPKNTANENTYNNIIAYLQSNANNQIDENELNYRRNARLLKEKMGRLGQTNSGLSNSDFTNLMTQRDKTNASIKSQLASDIAAQEANRNSARAEIENAASSYAANLISKLKG